MDEPINDTIMQVIEAVEKAVDYKILPGVLCKQETLKAFGGTAYQRACDATAIKVCAEIMSGKSLDLVQFFGEGVHRGFINNTLGSDGINRAYIESYEGLFGLAGVKGTFKTLAMDGNEARAIDLIKSGVPLILFIGAVNELHHVEPATAFIQTATELLLGVLDPGWQYDERVEMSTHRLFHYKGDMRVYSTLDNGKQRVAYKFGYLEKA